MSDDEIVKTLAEFMGWTDLRDCYMEGTTSYPRQLHGLRPDAPTGSTNLQYVPDYLTSYDALAPVLAKAVDSDLNARAIRLCQQPLATRWYVIPPRDHAIALATAIKEAR